LFGGEIEASDSLGISRTAYREAIRILAAKGLVESKPKAGTRVTPRTRWSLLDPDVLAWTFNSDPGETFVDALFELRSIVTPDAAALAATRRSEKDLAEMDAAMAEMERLTLTAPDGRAAGRRFYSALLSSSGNELLASIAGTIYSAAIWATDFQKNEPINAQDHRPLLEAVRAGDATTARTEMRKLIDVGADMALALEEMTPS
jgi:DNA-binding FadR family transcriptional regulator